LIRRDEPLITQLERQAGQKESRYAHLLSGEVVQERSAAPGRIQTSSSATVGNERIEKLESDVETLRDELATFRAMFDEFRKQFD